MKWAYELCITMMPSVSVSGSKGPTLFFMKDKIPTRTALIDGNVILQTNICKQPKNAVLSTRDELDAVDSAHFLAWGLASNLRITSKTWQFLEYFCGP